MELKTKILQRLRNAEAFLSGQQLSEEFHVSRTAIWKVMEQLKDEGYQIEAVRNKGYRLVNSPDVLSRAEIKSLLPPGWAQAEVVCYDETDSTNLRAKAAGEADGKPGTLFVAERQADGRGRRGRRWDSPGGESIYMSLLLRPKIAPDRASMLTLVMGLSVAQGIQDETGIACGMKWPNDVILAGKKVCGILTEMSTEIDYINYVVIGVGINVNQTDFPEEIADVATSLSLATGKTYRRSHLIAAVMRRFEENQAAFLLTEDLKGLKDAYNAILVNRDQDVKILEPGHSYEAHALEINDFGELLVTLPGGEEKAVRAGELSIRGGDTYV